MVTINEHCHFSNVAPPGEDTHTCFAPLISTTLGGLKEKGREFGLHYTNFSSHKSHILTYNQIIK